MIGERRKQNRDSIPAVGKPTVAESRLPHGARHGRGKLAEKAKLVINGAVRLLRSTPAVQKSLFGPCAQAVHVQEPEQIHFCQVKSYCRYPKKCPRSHSLTAQAEAVQTLLRRSRLTALPYKLYPTSAVKLYCCSKPNPGFSSAALEFNRRHQNRFLEAERPTQPLPLRTSGTSDSVCIHSTPYVEESFFQPV
jgi:hypothetical protein